MGHRKVAQMRRGYPLNWRGHQQPVELFQVAPIRMERSIKRRRACLPLGANRHRAAEWRVLRQAVALGALQSGSPRGELILLIRSDCVQAIETVRKGRRGLGNSSMAASPATESFQLCTICFGVTCRWSLEESSKVEIIEAIPLI